MSDKPLSRDEWKMGWTEENKENFRLGSYILAGVFAVAIFLALALFYGLVHFIGALR